MPTATTELLEWKNKQQHYQKPEVVAAYDERRFKGGFAGPAAARKWRMICRATRGLPGIHTVLDMPCGTGRFTSRILDHGWRLVNGDLSGPMLGRTLDYCRENRAHVGSGRMDARCLPLRDNAVDLALCIRFLMHVPRVERIEVLRELGRVARYVVLDVRHKYCLMLTWKKLRRAVGMNVKVDTPRYSMSELRAELEEAGLRTLRKVWLARPFSQKLVILCERADQTADTKSRLGRAK